MPLPQAHAAATRRSPPITLRDGAGGHGQPRRGWHHCRGVISREGNTQHAELPQVASQLLALIAGSQVFQVHTAARDHKDRLLQDTEIHGWLVSVTTMSASSPAPMAPLRFSIPRHEADTAVADS